MNSMNKVFAYQQSGSLEDRLKELIIAKGFKRGEVTLSSGKQSDYYFDLRPLTLDPASTPLIADLMIEKLPSSPNICVGGLEAGAIPIAAAICARYTGEGNVTGFFVRKQAKGHGRKKQIEGNFNKEYQSVIVEDVASTGGSIIKAAQAIREAGGTVNTAIVVVDRQEGAKEALKMQGVDLISLFTKNDFN